MFWTGKTIESLQVETDRAHEYDGTVPLLQAFGQTQVDLCLHSLALRLSYDGVWHYASTYENFKCDKKFWRYTVIYVKICTYENVPLYIQYHLLRAYDHTTLNTIESGFEVHPGHKRTWIISAPLLPVFSALLIKENGAISGSIDSGTTRTGVETRHFQAFAILSSPRYFASKRPSVEQKVSHHTRKLARYVHAQSRQLQGRTTPQ